MAGEVASLTLTYSYTRIPTVVEFHYSEWQESCFFIPFVVDIDKMYETVADLSFDLVVSYLNINGAALKSICERTTIFDS